MASTIKGCFYDGSVTFCYFTFLLLPPNKTGKLWMKICSNDRWEKVASLEFYHLESKQNFSMMYYFFFFSFLQTFVGWWRQFWLQMKLQSDPQIPCIMSVLHWLGSCTEVTEKSVFFLFGLGWDLNRYLKLIYISFGLCHFILSEWF